MPETTFGEYELMALLGSGTGGEVWRASDSRTARTVALRLLPADVTPESELARRFLRRARTAAALNDPHLVPIHDFGVIDGRIFVEMRLITGDTLRSRLNAGPLAPHQAVSIVDQVAFALRSAHRAGLVHRGVRPANVMVTDDGFVYLLDLELGLPELSPAAAWPYLAPEHFRDADATPACDVYSLTCVLFECLTGLTPFPGDTRQAQFAGHGAAPPPLPSRSRPGLTSAVDDVIARGMAKEPGRRYGSAADLAAAAAAAAVDTAPPVDPTPPRRRPRVAGALLAAVLALALCAVVGVVVTGRDAGSDAQRPVNPTAAPQVSREPEPRSYGSQIVLPFTGLNGPQGLAVSDAGDILVADMNNLRVERLAASGQQTTLPITGLTQPVDVALDDAGDVYVVDFSNPGAVVRLQADGALQNQVPLEDVGFPGCVAVDHGGNVYVDGHGVAEVVMVVGGAGPQKTLPFNGGVGDFDVDARRNVYAVNISENTVVRLDADWSTQSVLPFVNVEPSALAVGDDGSVYVTDIENKTVSMLTPGAKSAVPLPFVGLARPTSIAVDAAGNVFVSDFDRNEVVKLPVG